MLHLVKPLGFSIDDRQLKRAGLDYWPFVKLLVHDDLPAFLRDWGEQRMFLATTKGVQSYTDVRYRDEDMLIFGRETRGLPGAFIQERLADTIRIPMGRDAKLRSINLSNAAAIVLYEALRQLDFPELK